MELKVPLLQIPKLCQRLPHENETIDRMAVSEPPSQVSDTSGATASRAEHAPKAAEKPKVCKASVPMAAQASCEGMDVPALSSKAPKANSAASKDEHAMPKKTKPCTVVGSKLVSVRESKTSEPTPLQANEKPVLQAPSQASDAKVKPSSAVARKTDHAATKSKKLGASSVVSSKLVPESKSSEPPSQASKAKVNPSSVVARKTDHAAPKAKKFEAPSAVCSKPVPEVESSELTPSHTSEETVVLEPPNQTSKAKANVSNVVARETDHGALAKPNVSSVTDSKFIPVRVYQAQSEPVPPQDSKVQPSDQAPKAGASPSNAAPRKTAQAPTAPMKPKVSLVTDPKPIPVRVTQTSEFTLPQVSSVTDSKPIPVRVSQGSVPAHHTSSEGRKPAALQKGQSPVDYEDVSDVPLEEYCDDTSSEVSQVERGVVSGASCEQPKRPSCDREEAARLGDYEDVSDTPLTMYDSPKKSGSSGQPAHKKARRHSGEGVTKGPLVKKKVAGSTPAVKKAEEKCGKASHACPPQQQAAAKPKPAATNKVKAHLATEQGAAKLTATIAAPDSEPTAAGNGASKKLHKRPGTPCSQQDVKKRKVDTSSEKRKPDTCASTTQQNGSPAPAKKLAAKKVERAVSCTKISTKPSMAKSNNEEVAKNSPSAPSTTQQDGSPAPAKKLAAKEIEKAVSCTKISPKPSMANSNKEATKDSPRSAPSTPQQNGSSAPAKKLAVKKIEKAVSCTKISTKPCTTNSSNSEKTSKDSPMSAPKLEASKEVGIKSKSTPKEEALKDVGAKNKSEPTSAKMRPKADTGHSSVKSAQKKDSAKGVCSSKPTPPGKAPVTKSSKSTSPGEASVMKFNKNPPTCAATKGKSNCLEPNTLLMTVGSPNPQTQMEAAPAERPPQPPSSKATVKGHTLSSEATSTKACKSSSSLAVPAQRQEVPEPQFGKDGPAQKAECSVSGPPQPPSSKTTEKGHTLNSEVTSTKACKSSGNSVIPLQRQDVSKVPEPQLGKVDPAQKAECTGSTRTAPICPPSSGVRPGSGLKPCHASKTKEVSSEATSCATPRKRETEAKEPCSVADGQPGDHTRQEPIGRIEEQKSIPVENRCLDMPKGGQSRDTVQASAQKKTKPATTATAAKVSGIKVKKSGTAKEIEDRCDSPLTKSYDALQASEIQKTKAATTATTVKVSGIKGDMKNSGAANKIEDRCDSPSTSNVAAERNHSAKKLPTSGNAVKTKHPASKIVDKAAVATTDEEVFTKPLNDVVCSSLNQEAERTSKPSPTDEDATVPSEEKVEDQAGGLTESKTAATSPRNGESLKEVQESSMVSSPSCDMAERVQTDTNVPATQEVDRTSGMLPPGSNSQKSPAGTAALANRNCESLGTSTGTSTLTSPLRESACDKMSLTQQSDDSSASIIGSIQPRKESPVRLDAPASAKTMKQGHGNEPPAACDVVSTLEPVKGADSSRKPPLGKEAVDDTRRENIASTEESDQHKGEQSSTSPPRHLQGDCPTTTIQGSGGGEQDTCAALSKREAAGACKPDPDVEAPATSSHQDKANKPSPPKKKNKNKGPGTNTSLRSAWLFSRKKRGKRRRSSTETQSGSSPKKFKAADSSQGGSSSKITGEPSARPIAIKTEPADDNDAEATFPSVAPLAQHSTKKLTLRARKAHSSREDPEPTGNGAKKRKAADSSRGRDPVAQGSGGRFTGETSTSLIKKEPGTEDDVDTEAALLLSAAAPLRSAKRLASPAVHAYRGSNPKPTAPGCSAESPPACGTPLEPSSSSDSASAELLTPMEVAQMDLDMVSGLCILDVCGYGAEKTAKLREQFEASNMAQKEVAGIIAKAVHKTILDEYFKRDHAIRTLKLLAKVPFSLDPAKVTKIQQLTRAIVERPQAGGKP